MGKVEQSAVSSQHSVGKTALQIEEKGVSSCPMITPKLKSITSTGTDPSRYVPDSEDFQLSLDLTIGPAKEEGEELFYVTVCSPRHVESLVERDRIAMLRGYLICDEFELEAIRARIEKLLSGISGQTWKEVAAKLSRYFQWEYE